MSSQHLEEADELADRIAIMTKGQLLALDTPNEIKKRFGFGYKILIEPNDCSPQEFKDLKFSVIDPTLLSIENQNQGFAES
jgi:ABC-type multidrug transport system ATPase subunit